MYFPDTQACQASNSLQPASKAEIARGIRMLASMEGRVRKARQAFNCLLYRGDLNTNGWPLATQGGIPASTIQGCPSPAASAVSTPGGGSTGINFTGIQYWPVLLATLPDPTGVAPNDPSAYPQPPAPVFPPLTTQAHTVAAQVLVAAASQATKPTPTAEPVAAVLTPTASPVAPTVQPVYRPQPQAYIPPAWNSPAPQLPAPTPAPAPVQSASPWTPIQYSKPGAQWTFSPAPVGHIVAGPGQGVGDWDGGSFLQGLISAVGLAAAGWYLYQEGKKRGYI